MKNFKILSAFLVLFAAINMTSCGDTEPIDESIVVPIPTNPGQTPPGDCANPIGFQASNFINGSNVNLSWIAGSDETSWEIQYGPDGFNVGAGTSEVTDETNKTITGLNAANGYDFYVRAVCTGGGYSNWIGPVSVGEGSSATCSMPVDVTAARNETNLTQVTVAWTSTGGAAQWEIEYGFVGFTPGTGTTVLSNTTTKTLTNLNQNQDYHVWVQAICGADDRSNWAGPFLVEAINALSANVNNIAFVPTEVTAEITTVEQINYISINASDVDSNLITLLIDKSLPLGTYNLPPDVICSYTLDGVEYMANAMVPATVTLTQKTPHSLVGTFSFAVVSDTAVPVYTITSGSFAVTF